MDDTFKEPPFTKVYKKSGFGALRYITGQSKVAGEIALWLLENMDRSNTMAITGRGLACETGKTESQVSIALKLMEECNFIIRERLGNVHLIIVCDEMACEVSYSDKGNLFFNNVKVHVIPSERTALMEKIMAIRETRRLNNA